MSDVKSESGARIDLVAFVKSNSETVTNGIQQLMNDKVEAETALAFIKAENEKLRKIVIKMGELSKAAASMTESK